MSFFFSSRRRHTRYIGDWSSDVCSSDLGEESLSHHRALPPRRRISPLPRRFFRPRRHQHEAANAGDGGGGIEGEIGRASCRERGEMWGGGWGWEEQSECEVIHGRRWSKM